jgi:2-keto-4-pentenoate hydratase/2-oxohepta-3-ene-1,7-dioic acid hydratase in catechol pathway
LIPRISPGQIDWECELGVVIGSTCRHVAEEDALQHVAGYTVVNDISDRGFKPNPGRKPRERDAFFDWQHGKWHDSSCPVGPCIASAASIGDPQRLRITLSVNGAMKQDSSTGQMIFPVAAIIAFASSLMTLEPGDLISTGTPAGVGKARGEFLKPGDLVAAEIEGIGRLENPVEAE